MSSKLSRATPYRLTSIWVVFVTVAAAAVPVVTAGGAVAVSLAHWNHSMGSVTPAATEVCSTTALCPSAVRTAYGLTSLMANSTTNGTGQTIVIIDACGDSKMASDLATFDAANSLSDPTLTIYQPQGPPCSDPTGWGLETALDVEWSHVIAPGASIALVEAKSSSSTDLYGAWNYSLANHLGNQLSNSWGGSGACPSVARGLLTKATAANVSILASSGDSGAWGSGQLLTTQSPANCQQVVTVGGTTLKVATNGTYKSEAAWSGSGGGYTPKTKEPSYQKTANITDSYAELGKPDVAAVADPSTGVWVYESASGGWFTVGGTSVACPIWAGFLADVNSWRAASHFHALGNVDPFLYSSIYGVNGKGANYLKNFHDVTTGNNGWAAGTGWDAATGLGSFQGAVLAKTLASNPKA